MSKGQKLPRPERKLLNQLVSGYTLQRERIWPTDVVRFHLRYVPPDGGPGDYAEPDPELVRAMVRHGLLQAPSLADPDHIFLVPSDHWLRVLQSGWIKEPLEELSLLAPDAGRRKREVD